MCGITGVVNSKDPIRELYKLGTSVQHRGQESAGISVSYGGDFFTVKDSGTVEEVFGRYMPAITLKADRGIGHTRFSTSGESNCQNAQPVVVGNVSIAHNGNIPNYEALKAKYSGDHKFASNVDSEILAYLLNNCQDLVQGTRRIVKECDGAYNFVALTRSGEVAAFRDPHGYHPLFFGRKNGTVYIASEDCGLTGVGVYDHHEIKPGDLVIFSNGGQRVESLGSKTPRLCPFEDAYFKMPNSMSFLPGIVTSDMRKELGKMMARRYPVEADIVIPIMDSGLSYAEGFAEESGIPLVRDALIKNRAIARTYMAPHGKGENQTFGLTRKEKAGLKNVPSQQKIRGRRLVVNDDSIVRGNVTRDLVERLYEAGAVEIHLRIAFPPVRSPCLTGVDHGYKRKLLAAWHASVPDEEMGKYVNDHVEPDEGRIGATSIEYLPRSEWEKLLGNGNNFCWSCVTGNYDFPVPQTESLVKILSMPTLS